MGIWSQKAAIQSIHFDVNLGLAHECEEDNFFKMMSIERANNTADVMNWMLGKKLNGKHLGFIMKNFQTPDSGELLEINPFESIGTKMIDSIGWISSENVDASSKYALEQSRSRTRKAHVEQLIGRTLLSNLSRIQEASPGLNLSVSLFHFSYCACSCVCWI